MTLPIDIEGPVFSQISFAHVVRSLAFALEDLGCHVSIQATDSKSQGYKYVASEEKYDRLITLTSRKPEGKIKILYNFPVNMTNRCKGYNFAITSWETTRPPDPWIRDLNLHADQAWAISTFVNETFVQAGLNRSKAKVLKMGVDPALFNPATVPAKIQSNHKFKFLHLGVAQERKGTPLLLRAFSKAFTKRDDVCLVIKSNGFGIIDQWIKNANSPAEIIYIYEETHEEQLAGYYTAADCFVYPVHAEGAGLPVLESLACGKPAIVPLWSGLTDFCDENNSFPINHKLAKLQVPYSRYPGKGIELWADLDEDDLVHQLRYAYENPDITKKKGEYAASYINKNFTWHNTALQALNYISEFVSEAKQVVPKRIDPIIPTKKENPKLSPVKIGVVSHGILDLESAHYAAATAEYAVSQAREILPFGSKRKNAIESFNQGLLSANTLIDLYRKEELDVLHLHWDRYLMSPKRLAGFIRQIYDAGLQLILFLHDEFKEATPPEFFYLPRFVFVNSVKERNAMLAKGCPIDRLRYLKPFSVQLKRKAQNLRQQLKIGEKNFLIYCPNLLANGFGTKSIASFIKKMSVQMPHAKILVNSYDQDPELVQYLEAQNISSMNITNKNAADEADAFLLAGSTSHNPFLVPLLGINKPIFMHADNTSADLEGIFPLEEIVGPAASVKRSLSTTDEYIRFTESMYYTVKNTVQPTVSAMPIQTTQISIESDFDPENPIQFAEL